MGKDYPKFRPSHNETKYKNAYIIYVWVSLRKIGGPNHWAVVFELDNGKYGIIQFDTSGGIGLKDTYDSLEEASLATWGLGGKVRLSDYGSCSKNYKKWIESLYGRHTYCLFFHDCQNFTREIVEDLNGRWVGAFPIEDGPEFGDKSMDLSEINRQAGPLVTTLCALNPGYWLGRWLFG